MRTHVLAGVHAGPSVFDAKGQVTAVQQAGLLTDEAGPYETIRPRPDKQMAE